MSRKTRASKRRSRKRGPNDWQKANIRFLRGERDEPPKKKPKDKKGDAEI